MDHYLHNIQRAAQSFFNLEFLLMWVGLGLIIGVVAKLLLPGSENMGWIKTVLIGIAGSLIS